MKQKKFILEYSDIANIHFDRLQKALHEVKKWTPLTASQLEKLNYNQIAFLDMMTTRFGKLQDIIGARIFPLILEILGEDAPAFIDKLNCLEKLNYLPNADWWMSLREIRNQITHDYPNNYELLSQHCNLSIKKTEELLDYWDSLKLKIKNLTAHT
jgi:uncharacterized protein with HEPN domain